MSTKDLKVPTYKNIKVLKPFCPDCNQQITGDNTIALHWKCACGTWKITMFSGKYTIKEDNKTKEV